MFFLLVNRYMFFFVRHHSFSRIHFGSSQHPSHPNKSADEHTDGLLSWRRVRRQYRRIVRELACDSEEEARLSSAVSEEEEQMSTIVSEKEPRLSPTVVRRQLQQ